MGILAPEQKALPTTPGPRRLELVVDGGGGLVSQNDLETPPGPSKPNRFLSRLTAPLSTMPVAHGACLQAASTRRPGNVSK